MSESQTPKKSLGQHWLYDQESLEAMCTAAKVNQDDVILEIGPGLGTLTKLLVSKAKQVTAVEFDETLAARLPQTLKAKNLAVVSQDILGFDFTQMPADYKVVANIPYYLTSHLIRVISETPNPPQTAVLLIQKEVAERVVARPGDMSLLSVTAQFYWEASLDEQVPARLFTPPPKVDSQILVLNRIPEQAIKEADTKNFFRTVKAGFSQRRKTLLNSLSAGLNLTKEQTKTACQKANIDPTARAQTLSLDDWHRLHQALNT